MSIERQETETPRSSKYELAYEYHLKVGKEKFPVGESPRGLRDYVNWVKAIAYANWQTTVERIADDVYWGRLG